MMKAVLLACIGWSLVAGIADAGSLATVLANSGRARSEEASFLRVDWQDPATLPPRFRNHCSIDSWSGRPYCADHCGLGYQFYYCTPESFGCCRVGFGYCDWYGHLRCHP
jgi:hypothetical protein